MKALAVGLLLLAEPVRSQSLSLIVPQSQEASWGLVKGQNDFAAALYKRLAAGQKGNVFFSPYSISSALAMTYGGAKGETASEMAKVLGLDASADPHAQLGALMKSLNAAGEAGGFKLSVANALWGAKGRAFSDEFTSLCGKRYGAGLEQLDFRSNPEGSRGVINAWVEKKTQEKIKDLLPRGSIQTATRLVLTNAVYFKGAWVEPFKKDWTNEQDFRAPGGAVKAPLMAQTHFFGYADLPDLQLLEMPYKGDRLSLVALLPKASDGLPALEQKLSGEKLAEWISGAQEREVQVFFPRFKATSTFSLGKELKAMGMRSAFVPPSEPPKPGEADFSGMDGKRDLAISEAVHEAFVDVNEEGTEAAAATAVMMMGTAAVHRPPPVFRADHPFIYLIRDRKTGAILFLGRLENPVQ